MKRRIDVDDVARFAWLSNPVLNRVKQWVVYERMTANLRADDYEIQLVMSHLNGGGVRVLTSSGTKNYGAAWSPDGQTLAFISNRAYGSQVWLLPGEGGEARRLTRFRHGMSSIAWSPDGRTLYGLVPVSEGGEVEVFPEGLSDSDAKESLDKDDKHWAEGPKRYRRLYYKGDGAGLSKGFWQQLVAVDTATGSHRQLTHGNYSVHSPAVSPDGRYVAFISNRRDDPDIDWWVSDLYRVPACGGELERLNDEVAAELIAYSPDGQLIAVLGHGEELYQYWSAAHLHLFVVPCAGGKAKLLTGDFPDTLGDTNLTDMRGGAREQPPVWSNDGKSIYVLSTREGRCEVVSFSAPTNSFSAPTNGFPVSTNLVQAEQAGSVQVEEEGAAAIEESRQLGQAMVVIGGDRDIYGFDTDGKNRFVFSYATLTHPGKIAAVDIAEPTHAAVNRFRSRSFRPTSQPMLEEPVPFYPAQEIRLDDNNDDFMLGLDLVEPQAFWYDSQDGWKVQGWVMKPAGCGAGKKAPVLLEIHGGPQLNYGYAMFHEMQWFAAKGFAVVYVNPRGGMSYGQEFVNAVRHHYGQGDAADVLNGLGAALSQFDFLDPDKVAVTGGSYGGFMTNWLVGHTDRFFAAVSQRSISNWVSFYGCSDVGVLFVESQLGVKNLEDVGNLWEMSPLAYANYVKTPLLLLHSENDLRCPMEQAEQFYTAIRRNGGEVELLRIPNASHGLSRAGKPKLRIARLQAIFDFINDRL